MPEPYKIFISYSHKETKYYKELITCLKPLESAGCIKVWGDRKIQPGMDWDKEIHYQIKDADFIVFLLCQNFIASDYCLGVEMKIAIERDRDTNDRATILPIILKSCNWKSLPIRRLQALNDPEKPLANARNRPGAWMQISDKITRLTGCQTILSPPGLDLRQTMSRTYASESRGGQPDLASLTRHESPENLLNRTFHEIDFTQLKSFIDAGQAESRSRGSGFFALCSLERSRRTGVGKWGLQAIKSKLTNDPLVKPVTGVPDRQGILKRLASEFGVEQHIAPTDEAVIDAIAGAMASPRHLIVWIDDGDRISPDAWNWLVSKFWKDLRIRLSTLPRQRNAVFLIFVVTSKPSSAGDSGGNFSPDVAQPDFSKVLKMPLEHNWDKEQLLDYITRRWPESYQDDKTLTEIVDDLFQQTENGVPHYLYEVCYEHFVGTKISG